MSVHALPIIWLTIVAIAVYGIDNIAQWLDGLNCNWKVNTIRQMRGE